MNKQSLYFYFIIAILIITAFGMTQSLFIVNPGFAAIQLRMGQIIRTVEESGMYLKIPGMDNVVYIDKRINKTNIETPAMSRDLQSVQIGMVINYRVQDALKIYQNVGTNFDRIIIEPFAHESVKAVVAKFTAEDLIQYRHDAKDKVVGELRQRLGLQHIMLVDFNFIHLDFSKDFIHAVEEKQIAEQSAKTAKNLTEKIKEEALQIRTRADAESYAFHVKKEAVNDNLIKLKQIEAQLSAIEKWDGVLPRMTGNTVPMISFSED
jgi:prohibitin 2